MILMTAEPKNPKNPHNPRNPNSSIKLNNSAIHNDPHNPDPAFDPLKSLPILSTHHPSPTPSQFMTRGENGRFIDFAQPPEEYRDRWNNKHVRDNAYVPLFAYLPP